MSSGRSAVGSTSQSDSISSSKGEAGRSDRALNTTFFHGMLTRMDADPLLKDEGNFLLRASERQGQSCVVRC
ncbi:unnamed protein product [Toxocara canis]|uniref:SH2 domain-containing protein n=1 Tax=Toxocara canis TaxID=6265 RepID=A0A183V514_TOXCA|nr:unnamed protein product [Toxocara canis]